MKSFKEYVAEDKVDDIDAKARAKGFAPLTGWQKQMIRRGYYAKKDGSTEPVKHEEPKKGGKTDVLVINHEYKGRKKGSKKSAIMHGIIRAILTGHIR